MTDRDPVSVLLPTPEWGPVCETLAASLRPGDELLVLCDTAADPVADHDPPAGVEILRAGEPTGCSGKANALAYGMERAEHDRFVWTDDDFVHDEGWLERLVAAGEKHGPASAVPCFVGDGWWRLFEAWHGALFAVSVVERVGGTADTAWGGGVTFTREELTVDVATFAAELRRVLSDDYLLTQRLPAVHPIASMVTPVVVSGDARDVRSRLVRFGRIVGVNEGWRGALLNVLFAGVGLAFPLVVAPLVTLLFAGVYRRLALRRRTFLLAYPGLLLLPVVTLLARVVTEFEWGGRRYRFAESGEVTVLRSGEEASR
jgi:glycosyltransferase involved in cell wall biosynthesis